MTTGQGMGENDDLSPDYIGPEAALAFARIAHGIAAEMQCGNSVEAWDMVASVQKDMDRRAGLEAAYRPVSGGPSA